MPWAKTCTEWCWYQYCGRKCERPHGHTGKHDCGVTVNHPRWK